MKKVKILINRKEVKELHREYVFKLDYCFTFKFLESLKKFEIAHTQGDGSDFCYYCDYKYQLTPTLKDMRQMKKDHNIAPHIIEEFEKFIRFIFKELKKPFDDKMTYFNPLVEEKEIDWEQEK